MGSTGAKKESSKTTKKATREGRRFKVEVGDGRVCSHVLTIMRGGVNTLAAGVG